MLEKTILDKFLRRFKNGTLNVHYWDGTSVSYGSGNPTADMTVTDKKIVRAIFKNLSLGFGESYMDGSLLLEPLDDFMAIAYMNLPEYVDLAQKLNPKILLKKNVTKKQAEYIQKHYDIGNDFYSMWLDNETMAYTCAYFKKPTDTLAQAQIQKFDHVLKKLQLQKGMSVAEFGCGWGHLLVRAAKKYGVTGVGVTLSREQYAHATELAKIEGVDHLVRFELKNYQDLAAEGGQYDRVYSVGMLEHVGRGKQAEYFGAVDKLLKPGGISLMHSISSQVDRNTDAWIDRYIFPGGHLHAVWQLASYLPEYDFRLMDLESLRLHYAFTLDAWWHGFENHKDEVIEMFDERFYRMWRFYLVGCSASFRYGELDLTQMVFSKGINNDLPLTREHIYLTD